MSGWQHGSRPAEAHRCLLDQMVPEPKGWALIVAEQGAARGQMGGGDWVGDGDGDGVGNEVGDGGGVGVKDADEENVTVLLWMRISRISAA